MSLIIVTLALAGGDMVTIGPVYFDRDDDPTLVSATAIGRRVTVIGDSDTHSVEVRRKSGGWKQHVDGMSGHFDLSRPDGAGEAAMEPTETWQVECFVYGAPRAAVNPSTKRDWRELTIVGESAQQDAHWIIVDVSHDLQDVATIILQASDAPAGAYVRLARYVEWWHPLTGYGSRPEEDRQTQAGIVGVPTTHSTYYDPLEWEVGGESSYQTQVRVWYRAELRDASDLIVDSREVFFDYTTTRDPRIP